MANRRALESLKKIQDSRHKLALLKLRDAIAQLETAKQNLALLQNFRDEYHLPLQQSQQRVALLTRQSFLENLNISIKQQSEAVKRAQNMYDRATQHVQETYKSTKGFEIILDKCIREENSLKEKAAESELEDIIQTMYLKKD